MLSTPFCVYLLFRGRQAFPGGSGKTLPAMWETQVWSLGLEKGMATLSSIFFSLLLHEAILYSSYWKKNLSIDDYPTLLHHSLTRYPIYQKHSYTTTFFFKKCIFFFNWRIIALQPEYGNPLQYSCLKNSMDRGAWWATVHGIAKRWLNTFAFFTFQAWQPKVSQGTAKCPWSIRVTLNENDQFRAWTSAGKTLCLIPP